MERTRDAATGALWICGLVLLASMMCLSCGGKSGVTHPRDQGGDGDVTPTDGEREDPLGDVVEMDLPPDQAGEDLVPDRAEDPLAEPTESDADLMDTGDLPPEDQAFEEMVESDIGDEDPTVDPSDILEDPEEEIVPDAVSDPPEEEVADIPSDPAQEEIEEVAPDLTDVVTDHDLDEADAPLSAIGLDTAPDAIEAGHLAFTSQVVRAVAADPYILVLHPSGGCTIVDLADPSDPVEIGFFPTDTPIEATTTDPVHQTVFLAEADGTISAVDLSQPGEPLGMDEIILSEVAGGILDLDRVHNHLFALSEYQLWTMDIARDEGGVTLVLRSPISLGKPTRLLVAAAGSLCIGYDDGMLEARVDSGDGTFVPVGSLDVGEALVGLEAKDSKVVAAGADGGFHLFDVGDPRSPTMIDYGTELTGVQFFELEGRTLLVGLERGLVCAIDLSDWEAPWALNCLRGELPEWASISQGNLFVGDGTEGTVFGVIPVAAGLVPQPIRSHFPLDAVIAIEASKPLDGQAVADNMIVTCGADAIDGTAQLAPDKRTLLFLPAEPLPAAAECTVDYSEVEDALALALGESPAGGTTTIWTSATEPVPIVNSRSARGHTVDGGFTDWDPVEPPVSYEWDDIQPAQGVYSLFYADFDGTALYLMNDWIYDQEAISPDCYNRFIVWTGGGTEQWEVRAYGDQRVQVHKNGLPVDPVEEGAEAGYSYGPSPNLEVPHTQYEITLPAATGGWGVQYHDPGPVFRCYHRQSEPMVMQGQLTDGIDGPRVSILRGGIVIPALVQLLPDSGPPDVPVSLLGLDFGAEQDGSRVLFGSLEASIESWSDTEVVARCPVGVTTGPVTLERLGIRSNAIDFTVLPPEIDQVDPGSALPGEEVDILGWDFGDTRLDGKVTFGGLAAVDCPIWTNTWIRCAVPEGLLDSDAPVEVERAGLSSNSVDFEVEGVGPIEPEPDLETPGEYTCVEQPIDNEISSIYGYTGATGVLVWQSEGPGDFPDEPLDAASASYLQVQGTVTGTIGNGTWYVKGPGGEEVMGTIPTDLSGYYRVAIPLFSGENLLKILWSGESCTYIGVIAIGTSIPTRDIQLTVVWDELGEDWELHLVQQGGRINDTGELSGNPSTDCTWFTCIPPRILDWGEIGYTNDDPVKDIDDTDAFGPENIWLTEASPGRYTVMVEHWDTDGSPLSDGQVFLNVAGRVYLAEMQDLAPYEVWTVATIDMPSGTVQLSPEVYDCTGQWQKRDNWGCEACIPQGAAEVLCPPLISRIDPTISIPGREACIHGFDFGDTQESSTVTFNYVDLGPATQWSDQLIRIPVPTGTTGTYVPVFVTIDGVDSNIFYHTVTEENAGVIFESGMCADPQGGVVSVTRKTDVGISIEQGTDIGGILFTSDGSELLIAVDACTDGAEIWAVPLERNPETQRVEAFHQASLVATAAYADGGLDWGPSDLLFYTVWPENRIGEIQDPFGESTMAMTYPLDALLYSPGGLHFDFSLLPGSTALVSSCEGILVATVPLMEDAENTGFYQPGMPTVMVRLPDDDCPEGIHFVPGGEHQGYLMVNVWNSGAIWLYDWPPASTADLPVLFATATNSWGIDFDPLTGDLFLTAIETTTGQSGIFHVVGCP